MSEARPIGMGCMRLSTVADRDEDRGLATLHAALDAGVTLLDTADVYALDDRDLGHNERLIARALATWGGDRNRVRVVTKGGLTRPDGAWVPDGRAKALRAACERSRTALGVGAIDLYLLHAPDPRTKFETSVRALARLKRDGLVRSVGLCNVGVEQLRRARNIVEIEAVQVELSLLRTASLTGGVAAYCRDHGILLLAHSPLGSPRRVGRLAKDPALREVAERHRATCEEIALAWLCDLGDGIVPLPGASRPETARSLVRGQQIALTDEDRAVLDQQFPAGRSLRIPLARRRPAAGAPEGVVLIMGYPAAGKSTLAERYIAEGHERLNRDERGGSLSALARALDEALASGRRRFVLDNTYPSRASRAEVLETAWRHGVHARCIWADTSLEDAQVNAVQRMIERHGRLLAPEEISALAREDPSVFPPKAQFDYRRRLEPPTDDEGFASIERVPFEPRTSDQGTNRGLIVDPFDLVAADGLPIAGRSAALHRFADEGWILLGVAWRPGVEDGTETDDDVGRTLAAVGSRLGLPIDTLYCPHRAGPPRCWCRKPLPGLGVLHILKHRLDPAASLVVGRSAADRTFSGRLGFGYVPAEDLFGNGSGGTGKK